MNYSMGTRGYNALILIDDEDENLGELKFESEHKMCYNNNVKNKE